MTIWIVLSWIFVLLLTGINIFLFLKLKSASEQMLKMAFPGARDMNDAMSQMQKMMQGMGGAARGPRGPVKNSDAQLKAAMDMLQQIQKNGGKR